MDMFNALPDIVKYTILHNLDDNSISALRQSSNAGKQNLNTIASSDYFWIDRLNVKYRKILDSNTLERLRGVDFKRVYNRLVKNLSAETYYTRDTSFNRDVVAVRLAYGIDSTDTLISLLPDAVDKNCLGIVKLMLEHGVPVGSNKNRAILLAVMNGNTEMVKLLLSHGADPVMAINYAVAGGHMDIIKVSMTYGARASDVRMSHIVHALHKGFDDVVQFIQDSKDMYMQ